INDSILLQDLIDDTYVPDLSDSFSMPLPIEKKQVDILINELKDKQITVVNYVKNSANGPELYTVLINANNKIIGAGTPNDFKLVLSKDGGSNEYYAALYVNGERYEFIPNLIVTEKYDFSGEFISEFVYDNCFIEKGCFKFSSDPEEYAKQYNSLLFSELINLATAVAMFYGSAKQTKQETTNLFNNLKIIKEQLQLANINGVIVNGKGKIVDYTEDFNLNRQILESLAQGLTTKQLSKLTDKELLNLIGTDYYLDQLSVLNQINTFLKKQGLPEIYQYMELFTESSYGRVDKNEARHVYWFTKDGIVALEHENSHGVNEHIFGESPKWSMESEVRAEATALTIFGKEHKMNMINELNNRYKDGFFVDFDQIKVDCFVSNKFGDKELYNKLSKFLIANNPNFDSTMHGLETEWNMQLKLLGVNK
ncbi:MAG TPA: hypothetical protein VI790_04950, partial [Candidatus Nanoarchaeia archaeon]|nr:hypothetical protein [Candidatus Nanoarchaeia archaeon]